MIQLLILALIIVFAAVMVASWSSCRKIKDDFKSKLCGSTTFLFALTAGIAAIFLGVRLARTSRGGDYY